MEPNIFRYATKELSQDAFLCWLFGHASMEEDRAPKRIARKLLDVMIDSYNGLHREPFIAEQWDHYNVSIQQQVQQIDILLTFTSKVSGRQFQVMIEDKTRSGEHGDKQPERYELKLREQNPEMAVLPVFFKTGYMTPAKLEELRERRIVTITYEQIHDAFEPDIDPDNVVLQSWWDYFLEAYYLPITAALSVPLEEALADLHDWSQDQTEKEIIFDRLTDYLFRGEALPYISRRNVENGKAQILYEFIFHLPYWHMANKELEINLYFSWYKNLTFEMKTIPVPYVGKNKMSETRLNRYLDEQQAVRSGMAWPSLWSESRSHLQIGRYKHGPRLHTLNLEGLKQKLLSDMAFIAAQFNYTEANMLTSKECR